MQREKRNGVWRMLLCGSKRRKMSQSMIATSLLCVLISVAIAVCAIGYFTFQLVVGEKGKARVDELQQRKVKRAAVPSKCCWSRPTVSSNGSAWI